MLSPWLILAAVAGPPTELAAAEGAHVQRPTWSPDGKQLAWEANFHEQRRIELHVGPADGPFTQVLPPNRSSSPLTTGFSTSGGGDVVHELAWAPASLGGLYVYSAANAQLDYDLYVAGGGPVAAAPGADGGPAWSPDGRLVAFSSARSGQGDLYLLDVQRVEVPPRQLTNAPEASELYVAWSADGQQLAWVAHDRTGDNLFWLPGLDSTPTKLTDWSGNQVRPTFSPTSNQIAFYANREEPQRFDLYVVDAAAGATANKVLTGVVTDSSGPSWTPDGRYLVAVLDDDGAFDPIVRVPATGGTHTTLSLGTVGNGDLDIVLRDGMPWIAWVAQGRRGDPVRDFKRLFAAPLPSPRAEEP